MLDYIFPFVIGGIGFFLLGIGDNSNAFLVYKILGVIALLVAFFWFFYNIGYNIGYRMF